MTHLTFDLSNEDWIREKRRIDMINVRLWKVNVIYRDGNRPRFTGHIVVAKSWSAAAEIAEKHKVGFPMGRELGPTGEVEVFGSYFTPHEMRLRKGKWFGEVDGELVDLRPKLQPKPCPACGK